MTVPLCGLLVLKGAKLSILPVSVSRKINKVKTDLKEYNRKDNVFPDSKVERNVKLIQTALLALAVAGAVGAKVHYGKKVDFPKIAYDKFITQGSFDHGRALYKGEPFNGKIMCYQKEGFVTAVAYKNGRLENAATYSSLLPSPAYCKKRYIYDAFGKLKSVHIRNEHEYKTMHMGKNGTIAQKVNGILIRTVEPIENELVRRSDIVDGEIVSQVYRTKVKKI